MSSEWIKEIEMIKMKIEWLKLFSAEFWDSNKFREYIHQLDKHLENYEEIMIIGHFDSAFSNLVEKYYPKFRNCVMKVISHKFPKKDRTNRNRRGLEAMSRAGVDVKVNDDVHARMFIGYHSSYPTSELVIGSFDFNRDGMSLFKKNAGISTSNPDIIRGAIKFFSTIWNSSGTLSLEEYLNK